MAKLRDRLAALARAAARSLVDFEDKKVPAQRRQALDWKKQREDFRRMLEEAADVGEAASGLVRALAESRVLAAQIGQELDGHLLAEDRARTRGDRQVADLHHQAAAALADGLGQAERHVQELEGLVNEALRNNERARRMVIEQALELSQMAGMDAQLVALIQTNQMRGSTLELQSALRELSPGEREGFRGRALAAAERISDRLAAREELQGGTWSADRPGTAAGEEQLARAKARLGVASGGESAGKGGAAGEDQAKSQ